MQDPKKYGLYSDPTLYREGEGLIVNKFTFVLFGFGGEKNRRSAFCTFVRTIHRRKRKKRRCPHRRLWAPQSVYQPKRGEKKGFIRG